MMINDFTMELVGKASFMDGIGFTLNLMRELEKEHPEYAGAHDKIFEKVFSKEEGHKKIWRGEALKATRENIDRFC